MFPESAIIGNLRPKIDCVPPVDLLHKAVLCNAFRNTLLDRESIYIEAVDFIVLHKLAVIVQ